MKLVTFELLDSTSLASKSAALPARFGGRCGVVACRDDEPAAAAPIIDLAVAFAWFESRAGRAADAASVAARYGAEMIALIDLRFRPTELSRVASFHVFSGEHPPGVES